ncbi:hypothetical protein SUDANB95_05769 [Actinosynnema sp. ALI-1.44]
MLAFRQIWNPLRVIKSRLVQFTRPLVALLAATAIVFSATSVVNAPQAEAWPTIVYGGGGVGLMQLQ